MKDVNDFMPKIPGMRWGALLNYEPGNAEIKKLNQMMPDDSKWHTIFHQDGETNVDGRVIRNRSAKSMT